MKLAEIVNSAKSEIIMIDPYIDDKFLEIFTGLGRGVIVKILTKERSITGAVNLKVLAFNKQYRSQGIMVEIKPSDEFHDRFLIVDQEIFYHFGASFKDLGGKGFMYSVIEEPFLQKSLLKEFTSKWECEGVSK